MSAGNEAAAGLPPHVLTGARPVPVRLMHEVLARVGPKLLVLAGVFIVLPLFFVKANSDPDYWWHLRDGQWIVSHMALPAHDLYTFTASSHAWIDHEYLSEVLVWLLYGWGGTMLVSVAFGALTWLGFVLIYRAADGGRRPFVIVGASLVLAAFAGAAIWSPRVQMITFFFCCLQLYWLRAYLARGSRWIYWMPLVMVLWANLHGGWVTAFVFLGIAAVAEGLNWWFDRSSPAHVRRLKGLGLITLLCILAVAATPHGLSLYLYPFQTQGSAAQQDTILEWLSPNFHQLAMRPFEAMTLLLLVGMALRRPSAFDLLLVAATLVMALQSVRHIVIFVAAATPVLIATWSDLWDAHKERLPWRPGSIPVSGFLTAVTVVVLLGITAGVGQAAAAGLSNQAQVSAGSYPVAAADWMAAHPDQLGTRMFNWYGWGGYLAYRFYPQADRRLFIFGDAELMGDSLMYDYARVEGINPQWDSILKHYGVDYVVFNRGSGLDVLLGSRSDWKRVYADNMAVIYVRR